MPMRALSSALPLGHLPPGAAARPHAAVETDIHYSTNRPPYWGRRSGPEMVAARKPFEIPAFDGKEKSDG